MNPMIATLGSRRRDKVVDDIVLHQIEKPVEIIYNKMKTN